MTGRTPGLTPEQLEFLGEELRRALARLKQSMKSTRRAARPVELDQTSVGRLSRVDALQNQSFTKGLQERERVRAAMLQEALRRLEEGSYGACTGCGEPIAFERLMLFPETTTCARCAG